MAEPSHQHQRKIGRRSSLINTDEKQFRPQFHSQRLGSSASQKLWSLMAEYSSMDTQHIQKNIVQHVERTLARTRFNFNDNSCYRATAFSVRDHLIESWNDTQQLVTAEDPKRVYYLSLQFLLGRLLQTNLVNINMENRYKQALDELGYSLQNLYDEQVDPALGNGGLGRLAACFLDSMATLDLPAWGYGIRYDYGIFRQELVKGYQVQVPDYWLSQQNPWEIQRTDVSYDIHFGGYVEKINQNGSQKSIWHPDQTVVAVAYDTPIPGFDTYNTNNLRLWRSRPTNQFDFHSFNSGDYFKAIETRQKAEYITSVLYPNDSTESGKELRFKQQYFFVSATIQDILRRFNKKNTDFSLISEKVAIQLNDTHPAIAIPQMLRILVDIYEMDWSKCWNIVHSVFSYTNHTVLPQALEKWSVDLIGKLLPRHLDIIYFINFVFMKQVSDKFKNDSRKNQILSNMSLIEQSQPKKVRMANLCIVGSHKVNGVAALHTNLIRTQLFYHFNQYFPGKFLNKTNGVTPRRWIHCANRQLSNLYTSKIKSYDWLIQLDQLKNLAQFANDPEFKNTWIQIKYQNKVKLAQWVKVHCNIQISPDAMFDIMAKRIHQYKRQHMFALYMIYRYRRLKSMSPHDRQSVQKRVFMVSGKAAPGYITAKRIIRLINGIADVVNNDPDIGDLMKVVFLPNYRVSSAQVIIPAADLNEQISTAGTQASGTGNMKFVMNGAIIIGTLDGATVEIAQEIGQQNIILFGAKVEEVPHIRGRIERGEHRVGGQLREIFGMIRQGRFGNPRQLGSIPDILERHDFYLVTHDFWTYKDAQERADSIYQDQDAWVRMSILGAVRMGKFSSDRTINEYAAEIWDISTVNIPTPSSNALNRIRSQPFLQDPNQGNQVLKQQRQEREAMVLKRLEDTDLGNELHEPEIAVEGEIPEEEKKEE